LRSAAEQLVTELLLVQLTVTPPPQAALAPQRAFSPPPIGCFPSVTDGASVASEARKTPSAELSACPPCCCGPARAGELKKPKAARAKDSPNTTLFIEISFLETKLVP
jgi:hypothetical protein